MADFRAFEGLEYAQAAGGLEDLLSPPYDVIDAVARARLADRSPYNMAHLILPETQGDLDKYEAAGRLASRWVSKGVLIRSAKAFYVVEQRFSVDGREFVRTALAGHMRLGPWRENGVFPHELTLPKPRADRLNLYRAIRMQPGPIFSLFEDASGEVASLLKKAKEPAPYRSAAGPEGSFDRVWKVTDEETIAALTSAFARERFFIADGHHRYETALAYRDELEGSGTIPPDHPANFVLMCAVPFGDPGLIILPTHRLLSLGGDVAVETAMNALERDYSVTKLASPIGLKHLCDKPSDRLGIHTPGGSYLLRMKDGARNEFRGSAGRLMADLNVYEVRHKVLPVFFDDVEKAVAEERIRYTHEFAEAVGRVDSGKHVAAVILAPLSVRHVAAVASAGETMPPKSTYFYPKLPTGVVLKPLE